AFSTACWALKHRSSYNTPFIRPPFSASVRLAFARRSHARGSVGSLCFIDHAPFLQGGFQNRACALPIFFQVVFSRNHNVYGNPAPAPVAIDRLSGVPAMGPSAHDNQQIEIAVPIHATARGRTKQQHALRLDAIHNSARYFFQEFLIWKRCTRHTNLPALYVKPS